ncbi:hypothetical protein PMAYCL1PPCAC_01188, partial [Pristionchus mayeri]
AEKVQPQVGAAEKDEESIVDPFMPTKGLPKDVVTLIHFYLRVTTHFMEGTAPKEAYSGEFDQLEHALQNMTGDSEQALFGELVRILQVPDSDTFDCALCKRCFFTPRHVFMHASCEIHKAKVAELSPIVGLRANGIMEKMATKAQVEKLFKQERDRVKHHRAKWSSESLVDAKLRPTVDFLLHLSLTHTQGDGAKMDIMRNQLKEHIGKRKTRCIQCQLIFANADEYYEHLFTYLHIRQHPLDVVTLLINSDQQMRDAERRKPWPS